MYATDDYPYGFESGDFDGPAFFEGLRDLWGSGVSIDGCAPSVADDTNARAQWARLERLSSTPGAIGAQFEMGRHLDVRAVLPSVQVPVLMLHAENDPMRAGTAQYVAEHVADGRVVELRGYDHYPWFNDTTELAGQLEEFFTGVRTSTDVERVLTTV